MQGGAAILSNGTLRLWTSDTSVTPGSSPLFTQPSVGSINVLSIATTWSTHAALVEFKWPRGYFLDLSKGMVSGQVLTEIVQCPAGYTSTGSPYAVNVSSCFGICPNGQYNKGGTCTNCEEGRYSDEPVNECKICPNGRYQHEAGKTSCLLCPLGQVSSTESVSCTKCELGTYSNVHDVSACLGCPKARYQNSEGGTFCIPCPRGRYENTGKTRMVALEQCIVCGRGRYSTKNASQTVTDCQYCALGKYNDNYAASSCKPCSAGREAEGEGSSLCTVCDIGKVRVDPAVRCASCHSNDTYAAADGETCRTCGPGKFVSNDRAGCSPCAKGTYSEVEGLPIGSSCTPCPAGRYGLSEGLASRDACVACAAGKYGLIVIDNATKEISLSTSEEESCQDCPMGSYSNHTASTHCTPCPLGAVTSQKGSTICFKCAAGRMATLAVERRNGVYKCNDCPVGSYTNVPGMTACQKCGGYKTTSQKGQTVCAPCTAGKALNRSSMVCENCTLGKQALAAAEECTECPVGYYAMQDRKGCKACPKGTYGTPPENVTKRVSLSVSCTPCAVGTYNPAVGAADTECCIPCALGRYGTVLGAVDDANCTVCEAGKFQDEPGRKECKMCPANTVCRGGNPVPTICTADEQCDGKTTTTRPTAVTVKLEKVGHESEARIRASRKGGATIDLATSLDQILVEIAVTKETVQVKKELSRLTKRDAAPSGPDFFVDFFNLNFNATYYARARIHTSAGIESKWSAWSDALKIECPAGGICIGDNVSETPVGVPAPGVRAAEGYYRVFWSEYNLTFASCEKPERCKGGIGMDEGCVQGTTGPLCLECADAYVSSSTTGECGKCADQATTYAAFFIGVLLAITSLGLLIRSTLHSRGRASEIGVGVIKIAYRHMQLVSMAASFPLKWPTVLSSVFAAMNFVSNVGNQALSIDCEVAASRDSHSLFTRYMLAARSLLIFTAPLMFILGFAIYWLIFSFLFPQRDLGSRAKRRSRWEGVERGGNDTHNGGGNTDETFKDPKGYTSSLTTRLYVSTLSILTIGHPGLTRLAFSFFKCSKEVGGRSFLLADASIICWSTHHFQLILSLALPAILFYVLGVPAIGFYLLSSRRTKLRTRSSREKLGFLYSTYVEEAYYWELVIMARLVAFAFLSVMFDERPEIQAGLGLVVLLLSVWAQKTANPYLDPQLNRMEDA